LTLCFLYTAGAYGAVLLLTGPSYVAHPSHLVSQVGYMLYYIVLGAEHGAGGMPSWFETAQRVAAELQFGCPGWLALVPLLGGAAYLHIRHRGASSGLSMVERWQRALLWAFAGLSLALFLGTRVIAMRHLVPAIIIGYAFAVDLALQRRGAVRAATAGLLGLGLLLHGAAVLDHQRWQRSKPRDLGLQVGDWLSARYAADTSIVTDFWPVYVPPKFAKASSIYDALWSEKRQSRWPEAVRGLLADRNPDVVLVTESKWSTHPVPVAPMLEGESQLRARYQRVQRFENHSRYGDYRAIVVYERNRTVEPPGADTS
jgi:hypothetical protein